MDFQGRLLILRVVYAQQQECKRRQIWKVIFFKLSLLFREVPLRFQVPKAQRPEAQRA